MVEKLVDVQQTVAQADFKRCPTFQFRRIETLVGISSREQRRGYTGKPVSDRGTLGDVSQSLQSTFKRRCKFLILTWCPSRNGATAGTERTAIRFEVVDQPSGPGKDGWLNIHWAMIA